MAPTDTHIIMTVWDWVREVMFTGGGAGAVIGWLLYQKRKKSNASNGSGSAPSMSFHERLAEHEEKDNDRFEKFDTQSTNRHLELINNMNVIANDVSFIKGRMK